VCVGEVIKIHCLLQYTGSSFWLSEMLCENLLKNEKEKTFHSSALLQYVSRSKHILFCSAAWATEAFLKYSEARLVTGYSFGDDFLFVNHFPMQYCLCYVSHCFKNLNWMVENQRSETVWKQSNPNIFSNHGCKLFDHASIFWTLCFTCFEWKDCSKSANRNDELYREVCLLMLDPKQHNFPSPPSCLDKP